MNLVKGKEDLEGQQGMEGNLLKTLVASHEMSCK